MKQLQKNGAKIYLGRGHDSSHLFGPSARGGSMHLKIVVIDDRIVYWGGANVTRNSRCGREAMSRMTGPPTADLYEMVLDAERDAPVKCV